ncbi:MAG: hypothetical protein GY754_28685 [bacterium]|nr:hypothetical protein [bacterium]
MEKRLKPEILDFDSTIEGLYGLNIKNTIGIVTGGASLLFLRSIKKE